MTSTITAKVLDYDLNLYRLERGMFSLGAYELRKTQDGQYLTTVANGPHHTLWLDEEHPSNVEAIHFLVKLMGNGEFDIHEVRAEEDEFIDNFVNEEDGLAEFTHTEYDGWTTVDAVRLYGVHVPGVIADWFNHTLPEHVAS